MRPNRSPVFHAIIARLESRRSPKQHGKRALPHLETVTRWRLIAKGTVWKEDTMTVMNEASRIVRESFDKTLETGAETVRGVQEGFTSALENVPDLNARLI